MPRNPYKRNSFTPPSRGIQGTVSRSFRTPAEDRMRFAKEREESGEAMIGDLYGSTRGMDKTEYGYQTRYLGDQVAEFDARMEHLNGVKGRMDKTGSDQLNAITKKHVALQKAYANGRINQLEMFRGAAQLGQQLGTFNWKGHVKGKGAVVGDIYDDEDTGMVMHNTPEGRQPIGYTKKYVQENTYTDPRTGITIVPTAPGKDPKIYRGDEIDSTDFPAPDKLYSMYEKVRGELLENPASMDMSPEDIDEAAWNRVNDGLNRSRLMWAKLTGREGQLTGAQQTEQVEGEMSDQPASLSPAVKAEILKKQQEAADKALKASEKEQEKAAKPGTKAKPSDSMKAYGPQLKNAIAAAGGDKDKIAQARADYWDQDPELKARYNNPLPLRGGMKQSDLTEGTVYMVNDKSDNKIKRVVYLNGKLMELEQPGVAPPRGPATRADDPGTRLRGAAPGFY